MLRSIALEFRMCRFYEACSIAWSEVWIRGI